MSVRFSMCVCLRVFLSVHPSSLSVCSRLSVSVCQSVCPFIRVHIASYKGSDVHISLHFLRAFDELHQFDHCKDEYPQQYDDDRQAHHSRNGDLEPRA